MQVFWINKNIVYPATDDDLSFLTEHDFIKDVAIGLIKLQPFF